MLELPSAGRFDGQGECHTTPKAYVRQAFYKYLECGIFARVRCDDCGHDYFVAFSFKGRGICPLCNTRRMVEIAMHLSDHVYPRVSANGLPGSEYSWLSATSALRSSVTSSWRAALGTEKSSLNVR